ncbi:MAG: hypothetical protein JKY33_07525 [Bacteroidia bacterium]|nr:hypothetical protein [Bacteroidia bacterium]
MRKVVLILFTLIVTNVSGQNDKFVKAMKGVLAVMDTSKSIKSLQKASNKFERIAMAEKKEWLPYYYAAHCNALIGFYTEKKKEKDVFYDKALAFKDKADSIDNNNSEIYALHGFILQFKLMVNPMVRGRTLGPESGRILQQAMELDGNNPRPYYLTGSNLFYTPAQYGGGKDKACPLLEKSVQKYEAFKPESDLHPTWGGDRAQMLWAKCNEEPALEEKGE